MRSIMRSKPGKSKCPRCAGKGCVHCERTGSVIECPGCGNDTHGTIDSTAGLHVCDICQTEFGDDGVISLGPGKKKQ